MGIVVPGVAIPSPKVCRRGSTVTSALDLDKKTLMRESLYLRRKYIEEGAPRRRPSEWTKRALIRESLYLRQENIEEGAP